MPAAFVLFGPSKIGKTAVLQYLADNNFSLEFNVILIDLIQLAQDSSSIFFWELAQAILSKIHSSPLDEADRSDFVIDPEKALSVHLKLALDQKLDGRRLLILFDNLQSLVPETSPPESLTKIWSVLRNWLRENEPYTALFALQYNGSILTGPQAEQLTPLPNHPLGPLDMSAVQDLTRGQSDIILTQEVAKFILKNAEGQPGSVKNILHALRLRHEESLVNHATLADVAHITRYQPSN